MLEISSGVFVETEYEGVNVAAVLTDEGVICIDTPSYPRDAREWASRVARLHGRGARYLILTDYNVDRVVNSRWLGVPIIASQPTAECLSAYDRRYPQVLLDGLTQRNPHLGRELVGGPVDQVSISFAGVMSFRYGENVIKLFHKPGPGAGNIWVSWPDAGILFTGDSTVSGAHPPLAEALFVEWLESLESIDLDDPGSALFVPGRGQPDGPSLVTNSIAYLRGVISLVDSYIAGGGRRQDVSELVRQLLPQLPAHETAPEWTRRNIGLGLQRAYDQRLAELEVPLVE